MHCTNKSRVHRCQNGGIHDLCYRTTRLYLTTNRNHTLWLSTSRQLSVQTGCNGRTAPRGHIQAQRQIGRTQRIHKRMSRWPHNGTMGAPNPQQTREVGGRNKQDRVKCQSTNQWIKQNSQTNKEEVNSRTNKDMVDNAHALHQ